MDDKPVRRERTGWRDQGISERHRLYGWDCPAVDIDFLMLEFDNGKPAALVEYKAIGARHPDLRSPTFKALRALADAANIPLLLAFYNRNNWRYSVTPANRRALDFLDYRVHDMSEAQYVSLLYRVRGQQPPSSVIRNLKG